jgi:hypothetical protein
MFQINHRNNYDIICIIANIYDILMSLNIGVQTIDHLKIMELRLNI